MKQKLILGLLLLVPLIAVVGYISLSRLNKVSSPLSRDIAQAMEQIDRASCLHELSCTIRYYDEVLTQSARNYAFTQDKKWELNCKNQRS